MSDLISRQAAIDAINTWIKLYVLNRTMANPMSMQEMISALPSAQPEQRWIPCSERLPEDYTDVLVWFEYFRYGNYNCLYQMHGIGSYSSKYDWWLINQETGWNELKVFAWMPLPEPYRKDGEADG